MVAGFVASRAIVATAPDTEGHVPGKNWQLQDILVPDTLKDGEVLIEMAASGICHTDLIMTSVPGRGTPVTYPRIAGHEGSGHIKAIGSNVTRKDLEVGDPVLLSFASCGQCAYCKMDRPNNCPAFGMNILGYDDTFKTADGKAGINGAFFGHSSFAKLSVVKESSVLPAKHLVESDEELALFSPLGCGLQTGAGAVLNVAKPSKNDSVMVAGLGGVGLAALLAAKIVGCREIIAVDIIESRVQFAKQLGATKVLNTKDVRDVAAALKEAANDGRGPDVFIETTGVLPVQHAGYKAIANRGTFVFVGASGDATLTMNFLIRDVMSRGITIVGCLEGDSNPAEFIPELVRYYREGKFPIDKITKYYKADDFKTAVHDMHTGETIKAVLEW